MSVYVKNLTINQGVDFSQPFTIEDAYSRPLNLVGYGGSSYIRKHSNSNKVISGFGISFTDRSAGMISLSLGSTITSNITEGKYVYDVLLVSDIGFKTIVIEGSVLVRSGIST